MAGTASPMPYKDPEMRRRCQAESYRNRYHASRKFRREEAERKAAWLQTEEGREKNLAASHRHNNKLRKPVKVKPVKAVAKPARKTRSTKAKAVRRLTKVTRKAAVKTVRRAGVKAVRKPRPVRKVLAKAVRKLTRKTAAKPARRAAKR